MIPINCHLWQKEKITTYDFDFEIIKTYWDSSHFYRDLRKCKRCGQLYILDEIEFLTWDTKTGEDEIYTVIIPVSEEELSRYDFSEISGVDLLESFHPLIFWTPDWKIKWIKDVENSE